MNSIVAVEPKYPILDDVSIPDNIQKSWQKTLDIIAQTFDVPVSLIMRVHADEIEVFAASSNEKNVYEPNERASLNTGLYCETVMTTNKELLVPDALADPAWSDNPDIALNMISYLGVPLLWPNQEVFGTICVLDSKANGYTDQYRQLLEQFQESVQLSLQTVWENKVLNRYQKQLIEEKQRAEAASQAKGIFLANMSHELRTPLNAIMGFSRLLRQETHMNKSNRDDLDIIAVSGEHLLGLINDVLDMSKIEAGRMGLDPSEFDLHNAVVDVTHMLRSRATDKDLNFVIEISDDFPRMVSADVVKLRQVLINITSNAIKYTPAGQVKFRAFSKYLGNDIARVYFEVSDTGFGISEAEQQKIFEPFHQTHGHSTAIEGTGLGLAITDKFIRMMDGRIDVESEVGKGSTFTVELNLPVLPALSEPTSELNQRTVRCLAEGQEHTKVLIVEDHAHNRALLQRVMEGAGFDVKVAENGQIAVDVATEFRPDFVWMDMRLPIMNGMTATKIIKQLDAAYNPVIVALTTSLADGEDVKAIEFGCEEVMLKPFRETDLFTKMAELLNIEFIYHDNLENDDVTAISTEQIISELKSLNSDQQLRLNNAILELDVEQALSLLDQYFETGNDLHNTIGSMIKEYQFDELNDMLEQVMA